ncbi:hypothetical protein FRC12_005673 [Ceratobasidium sp. 428]|nr:hypothetical protein FRC12_005673 [Ceratobasidium sp. 428]
MGQSQTTNNMISIGTRSWQVPRADSKDDVGQSIEDNEDALKERVDKILGEAIEGNKAAYDELFAKILRQSIENKAAFNKLMDKGS